MDWKYVESVQPSWYAVMRDGNTVPIPEELHPLMNAAYNAGHNRLKDSLRMMLGAAKEGR